MDAGTISPVAVLRDARKSALLRTGLIDLSRNRSIRGPIARSESGRR
jgi:hypothetical protein